MGERARERVRKVVEESVARAWSLNLESNTSLAVLGGFQNSAHVVFPP